jgi:transcriptional regulator with XRE-family HTH domain
VDNGTNKQAIPSKKLHPNERLKRERELRGWSQGDIAEKIGTDQKVVSRWECGRSRPSPYFRQKLCELYGKNAEELGFVEAGITGTSSTHQEAQSIPPLESTDMNRRQALKLFGAAGVALTAASHDLLNPPLWERLSRTLARTSHVDETTLSSLEHITKRYWQLRKTLGYRTLLNSFLGHLETITQLLRYSQPPLIHKRLCSIASETAQYAGATLFDMNEYATARAYYKVSIDAAQEAEHYPLWAMGLGRMSSLPIYTDRAQDALPLLHKAQWLAAQHSTPTILSWLASVEAEAHAHLQDTQACLLTLVRAERVIEQVNPDEDPYGVRFDYARFVGYKGACLLQLHQPEAAITALQEAAKLIDASSFRQQSIILADAAYAYGQMGQVEEACNLACQALALTIQTQSEIAMQRIHIFRTEMKPWETMSSVKAFDDQLATRVILTS